VRELRAGDGGSGLAVRHGINRKPFLLEGQRRAVDGIPQSGLPVANHTEEER
jgi:hypothetical protein